MNARSPKPIAQGRLKVDLTRPPRHPRTTDICALPPSSALCAHRRNPFVANGDGRPPASHAGRSQARGNASTSKSSLSKIKIACGAARTAGRRQSAPGECILLTRSISLDAGNDVGKFEDAWGRACRRFREHLAFGLRRVMGGSRVDARPVETRALEVNSRTKLKRSTRAYGASIRTPCRSTRTVARGAPRRPMCLSVWSTVARACSDQRRRRSGREIS